MWDKKMMTQNSDEYAKRIDGKAFAENMVKEISVAVAKLKAEQQIIPALAVILVGDDPASSVYVRKKGETCKIAGMRSIEHRLPATTTQTALLSLIETLNKDEDIDGILVQLPLPNQIEESAIIQAIEPDKDVDGFHVVNAGRLATGQKAMIPCTPHGCLMLLQDRLGDLSGKHAVVIGRSNIVGKPMAQLLLQAHATVTVAHSRTSDLPALCRQADILIAAVGRANMVKKEWVKQGAVIIDVGINRVETQGKYRLTGDVDFDDVLPVTSAITPVPGGVGPMTIACLLKNTLSAACRRRDLGLEI